jgi:branched-chain amino acid transport system permease protein
LADNSCPYCRDNTAGLVAAIIGGPTLKLKNYIWPWPLLAFGILVHNLFNEFKRHKPGAPSDIKGITLLSLGGFSFDGK